MFIDEPGTELTVTVAGEDYRAGASLDVDCNGLEDTAVVETDDGAITFTDTDADGQADLMTQLDSNGQVIGQARFDEATGEWVHVDQSYDAYLSEPTHDTDGDGVLDSAVVDDPNGNTLIVTDTNADGRADHVTELTTEGGVVVSQRDGDGDWTVIERGHLDENGQYRRDPVAERGETIAEESGWISGGEPAEQVRIDPRTGGWVSG